MPAARVVERDDEPPLVQHQRHDLQAPGHAVAHLAQRIGGRGKEIQVHQRITHLAHQRGLQLAVAHHAHAHQHLAQRHLGFEPLPDQALAQLLVADHAQRNQCFADSGDGRVTLEFECAQQLLGQGDFGG